MGGYAMTDRAERFSEQQKAAILVLTLASEPSLSRVQVAERMRQDGHDVTAEGAGATLASLERRGVACKGRFSGQIRYWLITDDDGEHECEGHESLAGEHMGESVYCDGSCKR